MTEPMSCGDVRVQADADWEAKVAPILQPYCEQYRAGHDGYWQGLATHSAIPSLGAKTFPDVGEATPTDLVGWPWPVEIRDLRLGMRLNVDSYVGERGPGYQVALVVNCGIRNWRRVHAYGAEMFRNLDWYQVSDLVPEP